MDLINVYEAARLVGAENVDNGKLSEAEYKLQLAELKSRLAAEDQRRGLAVASTQAVQAQAQTADMQAHAAMFQGLTAFQTANRRAPIQAPTPTPQRSVNCITTGPYAMRSTNCN